MSPVKQGSAFMMVGTTPSSNSNSQQLQAAAYLPRVQQLRKQDKIVRDPKTGKGHIVANKHSIVHFVSVYFRF